MLRIENLCVTIKKKEILKNIKLNVKRNKITVILGKNGSGKSTLISCINQMRKYEGDIYWKEQPWRNYSPKERGRHIGILPQILATPHIKAEELVRMGRNPYLRMGEGYKAEDLAQVDRAMKIMGITDLKGCYVNEMSGGERQKVYLAMIVAQDTEMLILDEPATYLDVEYQAEFMATLKNLKEVYGKTILIVMHDLNQAVEYGEHIIVLKEGEVLFDGGKELCLKNEVIEHAFGVRKYQSDGKTFFAP